MKAQPKKANKTKTAARVNDLVRVMLDGATVEWDIEGYVREQEREADSPWFVGEGDQPLSYCQVRRYAQKAERKLAEASRTDRAKLFSRHLAQRRGLFQKAVAQGDIRAALAVLDSEARLLALFPQYESDSPTRVQRVTTINVFERVGILAEQLKRLGTLDPGIPASVVCGNDSREPLDSPAAHGEAERVSAAG
jgi:hypothetical protein